MLLCHSKVPAYPLLRNGGRSGKSTYSRRSGEGQHSRERKTSPLCFGQPCASSRWRKSSPWASSARTEPARHPATRLHARQLELSKDGSWWPGQAQGGRSFRTGCSLAPPPGASYHCTAVVAVSRDARDHPILITIISAINKTNCCGGIIGMRDWLTLLWAPPSSRSVSSEALG